jgi:hypothetical protein
MIKKAIKNTMQPTSKNGNIKIMTDLEKDVLCISEIPRMVIIPDHKKRHNEKNT